VEILLEEQNRRTGEKKQTSYQKVAAVVLGYPGRMGRNLGADLFMSVRHPIFLLL